MRIIEIDMAFPYLIYFIAIETISYHELMSICGIVLVVNTFLLIMGHMLPDNTPEKEQVKKFWIFVCKLGNVVLTILAFI